ncbi:AlpA family transcriptional regulator [Moraxella sp. VT-16-12]|uniref:helix-turn-helix transcriptional regulator n=1 Tax=Moraxella sp. VT-16-12 TaxID=2014877 RepID=UPI000B7CF4B4|nr:AlpA family phage regulatory protein [Moraxella sp. VT-16-12]TWV82040.1 AlpA family phage regulatory protein [Moraxella sp. VT-16-12]
MTTQDRLLKLTGVEKIISLKKDFIYSNIKKGLFQKPIKVGKASRWKMSEIQKWIDELE